MKRLIGLTLAAGLYLQTAAYGAIVINEFQPNPDGSDPSTQTIELRATAGQTSFSGFWGSIEGDNAFDVQDSGSFSVTFDANGLATFDIPDLENPTFTFFISTADHSSATGIGDITTAIDALGVPDNNSDTLYGATLGGTDLVNHAQSGFDNEPVLAFRDSVTLEWYAMYEDSPGTGSYFAFDVNGNQVDNSLFNIDPQLTTFGSANPTAIPEPGTLAFLGLSGAFVAFRRSRRRNA